jgi:hypothetical protein
MPDVQIRIGIDELDDLTAIQDLADDVDLEEVIGDGAGGLDTLVEPVTAVLIGAGVVAIAKLVWSWWDRRRGGLVIDQRPGATDTIRRDPDVPWGWAVVYPPDGGKVDIQTKDEPKDAWERLLGDVLSGTLKGAGDVAEKAKSQLGPAASVQASA